MSPLFALLLAPLLAADVASFDLTARVEARTESPAPGSGGPSPRVLQLDVNAIGAQSVGEWRLLAAYQPRLLTSAPDTAGNDVSSLLNTAKLSAEYLFSGVRKIRLDEIATYGRQDFSPLAAVAGTAAPTVPVDPRLPFLELLAVYSSTTSVIYGQSLTARLGLTAQASVVFSGGADAVARTFLPEQRQVPMEAKLTWMASRHDSLFVGSSGSSTAFSAAGVGTAPGHTTVVAATTGWRHELGPVTNFSLGLGGDTTKTTSSGQPPGWQPSYLASAAFSHSEIVGRQRFIGSLNASVNTVADRLTGAPYRLASGQVSMAYEPFGALRFTLNASGSRALSGASEVGQTLAVLDGAIIWQSAREVALALGSRSAFQFGTSQAISPQSQGTQVSGYLALTYTPRRFF